MSQTRFKMTDFFSRLACSSIIVLLFTSAQGCRQKIQPGHYEGSLLQRISFKYRIDPVHLNVINLGPDQFEIRVTGQNLEILETALISRPKKHQLLLKLEGFKNGLYLLRRIPVRDPIHRSKCFASLSLSDVSLCYHSGQFFLRFLDSQQKPTFTISGSLLKDQAPIPLEIPENYELENSVREALKKGFDARISLEHVLQARGNATAAWLNLLPHLTSNLIWNAPLPNYISVIATLEGLTPFLLPTWWMEGKVASLNTKIEGDAHLIQQANLASTVEQLFYALERDSKILKAYQRVGALAVQIPEIQDWVLPLQNAVERVLKEDRYALSLALGKYNPDAIQKVIIGDEYEPFNQAKPLNQLELADWAHRRSFELDQIEYLIQISKIKNLELYFTWLDPSADQRTSLGLNWIGQVPVSKSQTRELEVKRDQLKSILYRNAYQLALEFNSALDLCIKFKSREEIEFKFQEINSTFQNPENLSQSQVQHLKTSVQSYLADLAQYETQLAAYRIARAKKDRLILEGFFEELMPQLPKMVPAFQHSQITL